MLRSFRHKGPKELFASGRTAKITSTLHARCLLVLDQLDQATVPNDLHRPGNDFHPLSGFKPTRYSVHVNGPWCITFSFDGLDVCRIDLEQYH